MRKIHSTFKSKRLAWGISSAIALSVACGAEASDKPLNLEIKGQEIGNALMELGERAGVQIILPQDMGLSVNSRTVQGEYTLRSALDTLLQGSGLTYEFVTEDSVLIKAADTDTESADDGEVDEEVVVTGTRLRNVAPASPVTVLSRDDIDRRGFNSIEDIFRSLPQNFSGFNSSSHANATQTGGLTGTAPRNSEGSVVANLRGIGTGATLILVNGRRISTAPTETISFTDISTIPFGAIERVEIMPDGGSAIYGADAVGGVINFILKKDYQGAETRLRYENSSADADSYTLEQLFGLSWDSGNLTGTLRYQSNDATTARGAGVTTLDHRSRGGSDFRNSDYNAIIRAQDPNLLTGFDRLALTGDGTDAAGSVVGVTEADFTAQTGTYNAIRASDAELSDSLSPETENLSFSLDIRQELTDTINSYFTTSYSKRETETIRLSHFSAPLTVSTGNAFNNFGTEVTVGGYDFANEVANGLVDPATSFTENTRYSINAGADFELPFRDWQLKVDLNYSEEESNGFSRAINSNGVDSTGAGAESFANFQALLASNLNVLGDGSAQGASASELASTIYQRELGNRSSTVESLEVSGNGSLVDLPGGELQLAVGVEYRQEEQNLDNFVNNPFQITNPFTQEVGSTFRPDRELQAGFVELGVPLVGADNELPGVKELTLTLAGRYESYDVTGPFSPLVLDPFSPVMLPDEVSTVNYSEFSPRVSLSWQVTDDLKLRSTWNEGFQSPSLAQLFNPVVTLLQPIPPFADPIQPGNAFLATVVGGNANLQPQTSESLTVGFDYTPEFLPGLTVSGTWQEIEVEDQIGLGSPLAGFALFTNPELFPDLIFRSTEFSPPADFPPFGFVGGSPITTMINRFSNFASTRTESVDFDVNYQFDTDLGAFGVGVTGTYLSSLERRSFSDQQRADIAAINPVVASALEVETANTNIGPSRWRVNSYVDWSRDEWAANVFVRHSSDYNSFGIFAIGNVIGTGISSQSADIPVASYTTVDSQVTYTGNDGWKFTVGATNLFDKEFPFINVQFGADGSRVDFRRRILYLNVSKEFQL